MHAERDSRAYVLECGPGLACVQSYRYVEYVPVRYADEWWGSCTVHVCTWISMSVSANAHHHHHTTHSISAFLHLFIYFFISAFLHFCISAFLHFCISLPPRQTEPGNLQRTFILLLLYYHWKEGEKGKGLHTMYVGRAKETRGATTVFTAEPATLRPVRCARDQPFASSRRILRGTCSSQEGIVQEKHE